VRVVAGSYPFVRGSRSVSARAAPVGPCWLHACVVGAHRPVGETATTPCPRSLGFDGNMLQGPNPLNPVGVVAVGGYHGQTRK
jgi:hypothetical protein